MLGHVGRERQPQKSMNSKSHMAGRNGPTDIQCGCCLAGVGDGGDLYVYKYWVGWQLHRHMYFAIPYQATEPRRVYFTYVCTLWWNL